MNKSQQPQSYSVTFSFRDKQNFELATGMGNTLVIPPGGNQVVSERTMMRSAIWRQVTTYVVTAGPR